MEQLYTFLLASILLTLSPGPDVLMVIAKSIEKGRSAALLFTAGLMTGLCVHSLLLILGWAQFIGERPDIVVWIKISGCFYFCYLGMKSIYNYFQVNNQVDLENNSMHNNYKQGVLMNLLNPKVSLFFWLFFPGFLFAEKWTIAQQYAVLGGIFILQASIIFSTIALFTSPFKYFFSRFRLGWLSGLLWIFLGVYLVLT